MHFPESVLLIIACNFASGYPILCCQSHAEQLFSVQYWAYLASSMLLAQSSVDMFRGLIAYTNRAHLSSNSLSVR